MNQNWLRYGLVRTATVALSVLAVSSVVFLGVHLLPGNAFLGDRTSAQAAASLLRHYHLDEPLIEQYGRWLAGALHGDFGESVANQGQAISPVLFRELSVSAILGLAGLAFATALGLLLGLLGASRPDGLVDKVTTAFSVVTYSVPNFVVATVVVLFASIELYNLTGGSFYYVIGWGTPGQVLVPAITLGLPYAGIIARQTRNGVAEALREDYIRAARAKGLGEGKILLKHALPNGIQPVLTVLGPIAAGILTGVVVVENIFGIPGLGHEFVTSILQRDYNFTIAVFAVYTALIGVVNLLVDLGYRVIDPRLR